MRWPLRLDLPACVTLFDEVMGPVEGLFVRPEPRRTVRALVAGLLSSVERKNGWWLAEQAGHSGPHAMQRLLTSAVWDHDQARDGVRTLIGDRLGYPEGVLAVDETGFLKKGACSVGVQRQYTGTASRIENSQVAVFLTYASPCGRALVDRRLYPRTSWCEDSDRRAAAGVPDDITFATKPELAQQMVARRRDARPLGDRRRGVWGQLRLPNVPARPPRRLPPRRRLPHPGHPPHWPAPRRPARRHPPPAAGSVTAQVKGPRDYG